MTNNSDDTSKQNDASHKPKRGFATMSEEKLKAIAHKGGKARSEQLGVKGYSIIGKKGGLARAEQLGPKGYSEIGRRGGQTRAGQLGSLGFSKLGKIGSERLWGKKKITEEKKNDKRNGPT